MFVKKPLIPLVYLLRYGISVGSTQDIPRIGTENMKGAFVIVDVKETGCQNDTAVENRCSGTDRLGVKMITHIIWHTSNMLSDAILDR